ncbi:hypothetical protein [Oceanirhabdus seepicola]|uniref:Uncharacterized protein n=1 Tax=Oceanirhabdus seepicola TaxID=2828781 RepID=A0A9J6P1U2_9CLOT|nr:hypothetical protein [Oceanirhabdus seepicola]MCM1990507.1 hypothetical protein [Oceanirhabdus seepicola]
MNVLSHKVTMSGENSNKIVPSISENVIICARAKVIGPITIGTVSIVLKVYQIMMLWIIIEEK